MLVYPALRPCRIHVLNLPLPLPAVGILELGNMVAKCLHTAVNYGDKHEKKTQHVLQPVVNSGTYNIIM